MIPTVGVYPLRKLMEYRQDIQALRGIAVVLVLIYHAELGLLSAGYLGVDIFFVLSGYLITSLISDDLNRGSFSFSRFYLRRAVRLLPVAYVVLFSTIVISGYILTAPEYNQTLQTFRASIFYVSNIELWRSYDYFSSAADLNPLLHTWSLGIEEQFYAFWPLLLLLLTKLRHPVRWLGAIAFLSFALCLVMIQVRPSAAFYLLPTRGWELAIGAAISQIEWRRNGWSRIQSNLLGGGALAIIAVVVFVQPENLLGLSHPGMDALLVCLCTAVILVTAPAFLNSGVLSAVLSRLGDISYSLYLVHWPILVLLRTSHFNQLPPWQWRVIAVFVAIGLSIALYALVERPARRFGRMRPRTAIAILTTASLALVGLSLKASADFHEEALQYAEIRAANVGLSPACEQYGKGPYVQSAECRTSESPDTLVWGDSFAMHLIPWLEATDISGIEQATMSSCSPILGVSMKHPRRSTDWPAQCIEFNRLVFDHAVNSPNIRTVVMSSQMNYLLGATEGRLEWAAGTEGHDLAQALDLTIDGLRRAGKRVVFVSPTPTGGYDSSLCLERQTRRLFTWGGENSSCELSRGEIDKQQGMLFDWLDERMASDITYVDLRDLLCDRATCANMVGNTPLYRDAGHFSIQGSEQLAQLLDLGVLANAESR